MARRRFKSAPYVRRQWLAFRIFGEIQPLMDRVVLPVWLYEEGPPEKIVCDSREIALRRIAVMTLGEMEQYESYARSCPMSVYEGEG